jgi:hypothetical protein
MAQLSNGQTVQNHGGLKGGSIVWMGPLLNSQLVTESGGLLAMNSQKNSSNNTRLSTSID